MLKRQIARHLDRKLFARNAGWPCVTTNPRLFTGAWPATGFIVLPGIASAAILRFGQILPNGCRGAGIGKQEVNNEHARNG